MNQNISIVLILLALITSCQTKTSQQKTVSDKIHTFYYGWYGSPSHDKQYEHWNHNILPHWSDTTWDHAGAFSGGDDIGANFYPELGCYSSNDPKTIHQHFALMQNAGIGVCVMSWAGKDSYTDLSIPKYLDIAQKYDIKIAFHIEPFYQSIQEFKESIAYIYSEYGQHPSIFKTNGSPIYYVYDSYKIASTEWKKLLKLDGALSIRNSPLDGVFIGLWVKENDGDALVNSGFDGYYTYFASEGFVYGSTPSNWKYLSQFATDHDMIFIPCVGPGYEDTRIRPWNDANTKKRMNGYYYEQMFKAAASNNPDFIGITSFNEWHEGTQIEPAIPKNTDTFIYEDYGENVAPQFYIDKTKELIETYILQEVH